MNKYIFFLFAFFITNFAFAEDKAINTIQGTVKSAEGEPLDYVSIYVKGTSHACFSDEKGRFSLELPEGKQQLTFSILGFRAKTVNVDISRHSKVQNIHVVLEENSQQLTEVHVWGKSNVQKVKESAFNTIAIDAKGLHNSTLDLAGTLAKVPGVKLRESGGVGSDIQFSLDGFSGRHIKFFIDGVPLEGVSSFNINNIPVNFAERIEVYRGVVPVGFGADALGGVVNIVTGNKRKTFVDASYTYGSFNTHKSNVSFGHTAKNGFMFELNAFQNYSDNDYWIETPVKNLENGQIDMSKSERVRRFNDTYHNEAVVAKIGLVKKTFADRLVFGINLSQNDKEIQNGVRQEIVFGQKRRKAQALMPSFEYSKRDLFTKGLNVRLTANYNQTLSQNLDTATYIYNWRGESKYNNGKLGEQSYQDAKFENSNWNTTFNVSYRISQMHDIMLNHVLTAFDRKTQETAGTSSGATSSADFDKKSRKNISGFSYRFHFHQKWNISVFGKYYNQYSEGPKNTSTTGGYNYEMFSESVDALGYGTAMSFFWRDFQVKFSYEKANRLPTTDELFGDEDLEMGSVTLKPERSDNFNLNLSFTKEFGSHFIYLGGGLLYRDTKDYIRRVTDKYSGGLYFGSHENHGRVTTFGLSGEIRYNYSKWLSIGGNITNQNIRDKEKYVSGNSLQESSTYKVKVPNIPFFFFNADFSFYYHDLFSKGNLLTITYGNLYMYEFPLYWETHGNSATKLRVPTQFSHDLSLIYSIKNGRYNISFECRNLTDEKLYDNFSLQKPGRAFYGKFRYFFNK